MYVTSSVDTATRTSPAAARRARRSGTWLALLACLALVAVSTLVPLAAIVRTAVDPGTAQRYLELVTSASVLGTLRNTVLLGVAVGLTGTTMGFLFAFVQARTAVPGKRLLHLIALLPMVCPPA